MERGAGVGQHQHHQHAAEEYSTQSSFDNPATKKKPPKLRSINRSISIAIDDYAPLGLGGSPPQMMLDETMIEQPLIHRSASPVAVRSAQPPQTLTLPPTHQLHGGGVGSGAVSPALSARQQHQTHMHTFQYLAAQARHHSQHTHQHASSTSSPTAHGVGPLPGSGSISSSYQQQPDIYLVSSSSLGDDVGVVGGAGGSSSPIQFIDDYMLPPSHRHTVSATHPLKKTMFRRSDTIDVHPASNFQMKKTHSFHAQQDAAAIDQLLLAAGSAQAGSATSSRRTSSVRGNFLMPGLASGKDISRSPSPSRRGCRSHRSFNDPTRRPSTKPDSVVDSQIRHPSLNDELMESLDGRPALLTPTNLSLENELFVESRSRSNSHTRMEDVGADVATAQRAVAALMRKRSDSYEDAAGSMTTATHPPASSSSMKKREHPHPRQHSSHSLELDGRPSTSAAAAAAASHQQHTAHGMQLHSAAAAATAAYHFKRSAQHGRSLYLSPNNLEDLQVHRPGLIAAAAAFQGTNASAKQAKALHSASMRLRTYRETLTASKKSKSFIGDGAYPPPVGNEFELTSPHRRNSRPLSSAVASGSGGAVTIEDIKRSPRPLASTSSAAAAFIEEKRPSFERKPSLTYELSDAAFEQVLRPFHHKAAGRKASTAGGSHKALKKKSLSDETDEDEEADRKRKRIVCIVMTVFLCLACASVFVVILTLTHTSGQSSQHHHQSSKKIYTFTRETPVHYNVRQENERLMKETMDRARFGKNFTESASLTATHAQLGTHAQQIP